MKELVIKCGRFVIKAELFDTQTARMVLNELPLEGTTNFYGEELYFPVTFTAELEPDAREEVDEGTLAYWPPAKAFCIFFGPTPVSTTSKPRGYSAVNVFGKIIGDLDSLRQISPGEKIEVMIAEVSEKKGLPFN